MMIVGCPECGGRFKAPESMGGKKVRCSKCKTLFLVPSAEEEPEERIVQAPRPAPVPRPARDEEDRSDSRERDYDEDENAYEEDEERRPIKRGAWKKVRFGIHMLIMAFWTYLVSALALLGVSGLTILLARVFAGSSSGMEWLGYLMLVLMLICYLGMLAAFVIQMFGHGFAMAVPSGTGTYAKAQAIGVFCVLCYLVVFGAPMAALTFFMSGGFGLLFFFVFVVSGVIAYAFLYPLSLRSLAVALKDRDLIKGFNIYIITLGVMFGVMSVMSMITFALGGNRMSGASPGFDFSRSSPSAGTVFGSVLLMVLSCLNMLGGLVLTIWFVMLLHQVRDALDRKMRRS